MKNLILYIPLLFVVFSCRKTKTESADFYICNSNFSDSSFSNPRHTDFQSLLKSKTESGVVGISMCVKDNQAGIWQGSEGKADLHNNTNLQPCNIMRVGSTVKMFTATIIFLLQEEGKLSLDDKLANYLSGKNIDEIENAKEATIFQLLQHSSGIYNYIHNLTFQTASLNDLIKEWHADDLLAYAYNKSAYFKPGEDVLYSNTNYILLGLLIEKIEQKPLYQVFNEKIFSPLHLTNTQFAGQNPVPSGIARGYIDLYSKLQVIESTYFSGWDYYTADGGLISTPYDMTVFFQALMNGEIIKKESLSQMLTFKTPSVVDSEFYPLEYGLGIFRMETEKGTVLFHSGDAIGYYANMMYFPADHSSIVYAVNSNYGKIDQFVSTKKAISEIISVVKK